LTKLTGAVVSVFVKLNLGIRYPFFIRSAPPSNHPPLKGEQIRVNSPTIQAGIFNEKGDTIPFMSERR